MVCQPFQSLCLEIRITLTTGYAETAVQHLYLVSMNLLRIITRQDASCANVIEVVQILCSITAYGIDVQRVDSLDRLPFKTYIIIIGRIDNGHLRLCINHALLETGWQFLTLFTNAHQMVLSTFAMLVESTVVGAALTKAHVLNFSNIHLYLVVSD